MSIATSVVVAPSRLLTLALCTLGLLLISVGLTVFIFQFQSLPAFAWLPLWLAPLALGARLIQLSLTARKAFQLDISGLGEIRLSEHYRVASMQAGKSSCVSPVEAEVVHLIGDSTLWPNLLLLRLRRPGGEVVVVPVLADSLEPESFRRLSLAVRWIAASAPQRAGEERQFPPSN